MNHKMYIAWYLRLVTLFAFGVAFADFTSPRGAPSWDFQALIILALPAGMVFVVWCWEHLWNWERS